MNTTALFAGSFDPFTIGHQSIVQRTLLFADRVIVAIGTNGDKQKQLFTPQQRLEMIASLYQDEPRVSVDIYDGLTIRYAQKQDVQFIVRGIRSALDFEYERNIADANRQIGRIETVILLTYPHLSHISSSLVRELIHHQHDVREFIPEGILLPNNR